MTPDMINGLFELVGGLLICLSISRLRKDRVVRGVSIFPVSFFASWGLWNLYFYPSVDCPYSFAGGVIVVSANLYWVGQMIYYKRMEIV